MSVIISGKCGELFGVRAVAQGLTEPTEEAENNNEN